MARRASGEQHLGRRSAPAPADEPEQRCLARKALQTNSKAERRLATPPARPDYSAAACSRQPSYARFLIENLGLGYELQAISQQGIAKLGFIPLTSALDDDTYLAEIVDEADLLSSLAISIREGAYRRDPATIALHIAELRMTGLALVKAYRAIRWGGSTSDEVVA
jgi:hypothetical protein